MDNYLLFPNERQITAASQSKSPLDERNNAVLGIYFDDPRTYYLFKLGCLRPREGYPVPIPAK